MNPAEVYILGGFLGAGKTTLLKNLLLEEKEAGRKVAVVMNELGKESIDSDAVSEDIPLKELLNGCVCCTMQGQFEAQLYDLLTENELDVIYIETTGAAHPVEVLDSCLSPLFADKLFVKGIVSLVDGSGWQDQDRLSIPARRLLIEQIKHADLVLLNKTDLMSESLQAKTVQQLQAIQTNGKLIMTTHARIRLEDLKKLTSSQKGPIQKAAINEQLHMKTYVHKFPGKVELEGFEQFLRDMPESIYRIKGYLSFSDSDGSFSVQYSYGMPLYMKEPIKMKSLLVFIGENLDHGWIRKQMDQITIS
ncbi:GTP-binding protein [Bacillus sp. FJAT-42376]|uniref:CobW family GTP-binding protein n=1 Tax=Bacillus sp. FJAT-42376 TaxID=2014076 RepID=UPI000F4FC77A|nr:GTP-binding protein [Bacillus sp. FJAT-42376]AZB42660.1 GTP-binding protein [Bacillus sp. FJAT-42376]